MQSTELSGGAKDVSVVRLQKALGVTADGIVGSGTVGALAARASQLPKLPSVVKTALKAAPLVMALSSDARETLANLIANNASAIATVVEAANIFVPGGGGAGGKYPAGVVARYHTKERVYWIFPPGSPLSGSEDAVSVMGLGTCTNMTGCNTSLAGAQVETLGADPTGVIGKEPAPPPGAIVGSSIGAIYTKWWFWALVGAGGVAAIGTTVVRKRKRS